MFRLYWLASLLFAHHAQDLVSEPVTIYAGVYAAPKKLIFLDFYNESNDQNYRFLATSYGNAVDQAIRGRYRYAVVPPEKWRSYAQEKQWAARDYYDQAKIRQMGRDLGADGIIYGRFVVKDDVQLVIRGRILSVVDGEILGDEEGSAKSDSTMFSTINSLAQNLAVKIKDLFVPSDRGALWRAAVLPGWGHFYKERRNWGNFWSIAVGTAATYTLVTTTLFLAYRQQYIDASPEAYRNRYGHLGLYDETAAQAEFDRLERLTNQWGSLALAGVITTATLYVANILHAWLIKPDLGNVQSAGSAGALRFSLTGEAAPGFGLRVVGAYAYAF